MSIYNTLLGQYKNHSDEPPVPPEPVVDKYTPFYVEDISGSDNTLSIKKNKNTAATLTIEKSLDAVNWTSMGTTSTTEITATVPSNGKLYLRCSTNVWGNTTKYNSINCSGRFNTGGNIMSLLYGSSFTGEETTFPSSKAAAFNSLFRFATTLVSAGKLLLPAIKLTNYCYLSLFSDCTSLTTPPELPATELAQYCYSYLFSGCTSLNYIKVGFSTWPDMSSSGSTNRWTQLTVNTTGTFVCPAGLPQEFNASGNNTGGTSSISGLTNAIPYGWTVETF